MIHYTALQNTAPSEICRGSGLAGRVDWKTQLILVLDVDLQLAICTTHLFHVCMVVDWRLFPLPNVYGEGSALN